MFLDSSLMRYTDNQPRIVTRSTSHDSVDQEAKTPNESHGPSREGIYRRGSSARILLNRCFSTDDIDQIGKPKGQMPVAKGFSTFQMPERTHEKSDCKGTRPNMMRRAMSVRNLKIQEMPSSISDRRRHARKDHSTQSPCNEEEKQCNELESGNDTSQHPRLDRRKTFRPALSMRKLSSTVDGGAQRFRLPIMELNVNEKEPSYGSEKKLSRRDLFHRSMSVRETDFHGGEHDPDVAKDSLGDKPGQRRQFFHSKSSVEESGSQSRRKMLGRSLSIRNIGVKDSKSQRPLTYKSGSAVEPAAASLSMRNLVSKSSSDYEIEGNGQVQRRLLSHSKSLIKDVTAPNRLTKMGMRSFSSRNLPVSPNEHNSIVQVEKTVPPSRGPGRQENDSIRGAKDGQVAQSKKEMTRQRKVFSAVIMMLVQHCLQGLMTLGSVMRHNRSVRLVWTTLLDLLLFAIGRSFTIVLWCLATVLTGVRVSSEWLINRKCVQKAAASLYACESNSN